MKSANLLTCFVMTFSVIQHAAAQEQSRESSVDKAARAYHEQEEALAKLQKAMREKAADGQKTDSEQLRNELRLLVKKSFDARQKLRSAQVKELQRRLHDIELAIGKSQANEETIIDARLSDLLSGRPTSGRYVTVREQRVEDGQLKTVERRAFVQTSNDGDTGTVAPAPNAVPVPGQHPIKRIATSEIAPPRTYQTSKEPEAERPFAHFDIDTREQLAKLDLEKASAERVAASSNYGSHMRANQKAPGSTPQPEMNKLAVALQVAEIEVKRAETKLEGFARERAELTAAAEAEVEEAEATRRKAEAKRQADIASAEAAEAEIAKAEAVVASSQTNFDSYKKQHGRVKQLRETNAITQERFDQLANELDVAKGALESARAAVVIAKADARQAKSLAEESQADLELAEVHLRAAQARRDRLTGAAKTKQQAPQDRLPELRQESE